MKRWVPPLLSRQDVPNPPCPERGTDFQHQGVLLARHNLLSLGQRVIGRNFPLYGIFPFPSRTSSELSGAVFYFLTLLLSFDTVLLTWMEYGLALRKFL